MKLLIKLLLPLIKNYLLAELTKDENRTFVITKLSQHIDIPNLSEVDEKQVIENIYNSLTILLESYLSVKK